MKQFDDQFAPFVAMDPAISRQNIRGNKVIFRIPLRQEASEVCQLTFPVGLVEHVMDILEEYMVEPMERSTSFRIFGQIGDLPLHGTFHRIHHRTLHQMFHQTSIRYGGIFVIWEVCGGV